TTLDAGGTRGLANQLGAAPAPGRALPRPVVFAVAADAAQAATRTPVAPCRREGAGAALVDPQGALAVAPGAALAAGGIGCLVDQLRTPPVAYAAFAVAVLLAVALHVLAGIGTRMRHAAAEQARAALVHPRHATAEAPGLALDAARLRDLLHQLRAAPVGTAFAVAVTVTAAGQLLTPRQARAVAGPPR